MTPLPLPARASSWHLLAAIVAAWWRGLHRGALILTLVLSAASYRRAWRPAIARHLVQATAPHLLWFVLLAALLSLVIVRIVLVTAQSYGLSQFALEMVVRVLVLELIPLAAALFVAVRVTIPASVDVLALSQGPQAAELRRAGSAAWQAEVVPRAVAGLFAVLLLAALSGMLALVLAYLLAHGFSPWGFDQYTRLVGRVFSPAVSLVFGLKTLALSVAVSVIPLSAGLPDGRRRAGVLPPQLQGLVRLFFALLVIETASLLGNYL